MSFRHQPLLIRLPAVVFTVARPQPSQTSRWTPALCNPPAPANPQTCPHVCTSIILSSLKKESKSGPIIFSRHQPLHARLPAVAFTVARHQPSQTSWWIPALCNPPAPASPKLAHDGARASCQFEAQIRPDHCISDISDSVVTSRFRVFLQP